MDFETNFEGCLSAEEHMYNTVDAMSVDQKFAMAFNPTLGPKRSRDCQCIFEIAQIYLGDEEFNNVMNAFKQGRRGSSKKALRKAIPAAFVSCF